MSEEKNKSIARLYWEEAINKGNLDVLDEVYNPDSVIHDPASDTGELRGADLKEDSVIWARNAFPDIHATIEEPLIAEGDKVAYRWTFRGTHQGEFTGVAPTGREVEVTGIDIVRIARGKIVEAWGVWDALGAMRQLGAIPEPGQVGT
jgi:steroid delta-isomerase-like uncharacterized protein